MTEKQFKIICYFLFKIMNRISFTTTTFKDAYKEAERNINF